MRKKSGFQEMRMKMGPGQISAAGTHVGTHLPERCWEVGART